MTLTEDFKTNGMNAGCHFTSEVYTDTSRGLHYNGNKISDFIRFCSVLSTSTRLQGVRWNFRAVVMVSFVAVITKARD